MATLVPLRNGARHLDRLVRLLHEDESLPPSAFSKGIRLWSVTSGILFAYGVLSIGVGQYLWARYLLLLLAANMTILFVRRRTFRRLHALASSWRLHDTLWVTSWRRLGMSARNCLTKCPWEG